jgi:hypothetical protein
VLVLSPLVLAGGELVNRHYLGQLRVRPARILPERVRGLRRYSRDRPVLFLLHLGRPGVSAADVRCGHRFGRLAFLFLTNPAWIMLTAPARWLVGRLRQNAGHGRRWRPPPPAGVREPRRPNPGLPAGAIALPEPTDLI